MSCRIVKFTGLLVLALVNLSGNWRSPDWLLSDEDIAFEKNQTASALSSPLGESPAWESFNEWLCFTTKDVDFLTVEHVFNQGTDQERVETSPAIATTIESEEYLFDYENVHFTGENANEILLEWEKLANEEQDICIFAAFLEASNSLPFTWIISGIKTAKGYWPPEKEKFFSTSHSKDQDFNF